LGKRRIETLAVSGIMIVTAGLLAVVSTAASAVASTTTTGQVTHTVGTDPCGGDVCEQIYSVNNSNGTYTIEVWAPTQTFYGHFELQTPEHKTYNSPDNTNHAGGLGHFFVVPQQSGVFAATAWETSGNGGYNKIGYTTMTL
jgi:hypothetical protein